MDSIKQNILKVFYDFKVGKDEVLPFQSLQSRIMNWDRGQQDKADEAIQELIRDGYIKKSKRGYILLEKGYNYLYL